MRMIMRIQTLQPSVERPQPTQPRGTHTHTHTAGSATRFGGRYSAHLLPLIISPPSEENDTIRTTTVSARSQRVQTRSQVAKRAKSQPSRHADSGVGAVANLAEETSSTGPEIVQQQHKTPLLCSFALW